MSDASSHTDEWTPLPLDIPPHWEQIDFEDAFENISLSHLKIPQKEYLSSGTIPIVDQGANLIGGFTNDASRSIRPNRALIVFGDHTKCFKLVGFRFAPGADGVKVLRPITIDERFAYYACRALRLPDRGYSRHYAFLKKSKLPLAPQNEQRRIVAKIEELFSELDKGIESLKTARAKLNIYRQAVLKHTFEGKLTAQWREENKDKLETPEQLLARIKQERGARYEQQLQEWKAADTKWQEEQKDDYRPNKPRKLSNLVTIAAKKNEVTPKSWLSLKIDGVCDIIDGDRGPNYPKKDDYLPDGYCLFLNAKNVTKKGFVFDECQFISEERHHSLRKGGVEIGDIIFTSRGTIGNVALHSSALDFVAIRINSGMFILRNYSPIMIGDYFTSLLISPIITKQIKRLNSGTAQPQLPIREFKQFVIPVPPIPEQEVIVRTIEAQMSSIDAIESDLARQLSSADALRQSILKKAFSGQLVPQDPNDEPASILLERIKAEKAARSQNNTRAKRRRTTATA